MRVLRRRAGKADHRRLIGVTVDAAALGALNPVQELNGSNGVVANMLTGLNIDEFFTRREPSCCGPLSYLSDALGSTLALTGSSGAVQNQYQYEPFGNAWSPVYNNTSTNSYQFTGRENDGESGYNLYYYRGCYYSPVFQRFISQDPIETFCRLKGSMRWAAMPLGCIGATATTAFSRWTTCAAFALSCVPA